MSPIAGSALSGFALTLDSSGRFSTSSQVTGHLLAASYIAPTPYILTVAIGDMETAFADATSRVDPNFTNLASGKFHMNWVTILFSFRPPGHIGGLVLVPGLYQWTNAVTASADFTITGTATDSMETSFFALSTSNSTSLDFPDCWHIHHCHWKESHTRRRSSQRKYCVGCK